MTRTLSKVFPVKITNSAWVKEHSAGYMERLA
jgi:hypothetical protein